MVGHSDKWISAMIDLGLYHGEAYLGTDDLKSLLEEAEEERRGIVDDIEEAEDPLLKADLLKELAMWDAENGAKLKELREARASLPDDGELCIRDDLMESYLDDMVANHYELPKNLPSFISLTLDYDALKQDYTAFNLGGHTYWVRYA